MALAKITPEIIGNGGRRNLIINGDMRIHQRVSLRTNSTSPSTSMIADKFVGIGYGTGSTGISITDTRGTDPVVGTYIQSTNNTVPTIAATYPNDWAYLFATYLEGYDASVLYNQNAVLSFDWYASSAGTFCVTFRTGALDASYVATFNYNTANTWQHIEIPIYFDTTIGGTWNADNNWGLVIDWGLYNPAGSTYIAPAANIWYATNYHSIAGATNWTAIAGFTARLTNVQLEKGNVATPFEHRPFAEELIRCMRYYQKSYPYSMAPGTATSSGCIFGVSHGTSNGTVELCARLPVTLRQYPSATIYSSSGAAGMMHTSGNTDIAAAGTFTPNSVRIYNSATTTAGITHYAHYVLNADFA